jgi:7-cyano-7-deazaguanine reductase
MTQPPSSGDGAPPPPLTLLGNQKAKTPGAPDAGILEVFPNPRPGRDYTITFDCLEFTSLCPVTGQPDFATLSIRYIPDQVCVESKSLKLYLGAYRNQGSFSETIVNQILDDLASVLDPMVMTVKAAFSPRGGIGIEVEATYPEVDEGFDLQDS